MQDRTIVVLDAEGGSVHVDLLPAPSNTSINTAVFPVSIPAAGFNTYFLQYVSETDAEAKMAAQVRVVGIGSLFVGFHGSKSCI